MQDDTFDEHEGAEEGNDEEHDELDGEVLKLDEEMRAMAEEVGLDPKAVLDALEDEALEETKALEDSAPGGGLLKAPEATRVLPEDSAPASSTPAGFSHAQAAARLWRGKGWIDERGAACDEQTAPDALPDDQIAAMAKEAGLDMESIMTVLGEKSVANTKNPEILAGAPVDAYPIDQLLAELGADADGQTGANEFKAAPNEGQDSVAAMLAQFEEEQEDYKEDDADWGGDDDDFDEEMAEDSEDVKDPELDPDMAELESALLSGDTMALEAALGAVDNEDMKWKSTAPKSSAMPAAAMAVEAALAAAPPKPPARPEKGAGKGKGKGKSKGKETDKGKSKGTGKGKGSGKAKSKHKAKSPPDTAKEYVAEEGYDVPTPCKAKGKAKSKASLKRPLEDNMLQARAEMCAGSGGRGGALGG